MIYLAKVISLLTLIYLILYLYIDDVNNKNLEKVQYICSVANKYKSKNFNQFHNIIATDPILNGRFKSNPIGIHIDNYFLYQYNYLKLSFSNRAMGCRVIVRDGVIIDSLIKD